MSWRKRAAAGAVVTAVTVGMRDPGEASEDTPLFAEARDELPIDGIAVYFHPEVPEATLVLLRRRT